MKLTRPKYSKSHWTSIQLEWHSEDGKVRVNSHPGGRQKGRKCLPRAARCGKVT